MASTVFVDNSSIIYSSWLNDINATTYSGTFISSTITPSNIVCNGSVSGTGFTGLVNNVLSAPGQIGNGTPNTGAFTTLSTSGLASLNSLSLTTALSIANGGTGLATLTANNLLVGNGTSAPSFIAPTATGNIPFSTNGTTFTSVAKIFRETAQASTSGTNIDFTSIPSWVKRITVMFNGVSATGSNTLLVQLGTSSGIETTGYNSLVATDRGVEYTSTTGLIVGSSGSLTSSSTISGTITILLISGTTFVSSTCCADIDGSNPRSITGGGNKTLASALTQLRVLSSVAFDAGSINILYE